MNQVGEVYPVMETVACIGNSEKKAVVQLLVEPGELVTAPDLNRRFAEAQDPVGAVGYDSLNNLAQNVTSSHRRAGTFVTADVVRYSDWWARKATDSEIPDAVAGLNLGLSDDYDLSLERFWGKVSTPKGALNSPEIRSRMFGHLSGLAVDESVSLSALAAATGVKRNVVHSNVQKLFGNGFVNYSAINPFEQEVSFTITSDPTVPSTQTRGGTRVRENRFYLGDPTLRRRTVDVLASKVQEGETKVTYEELDQGLQATGDVNRNTLHGVMAIMLREGIITRNHIPTKNKDAFSEISMDEDQKAIIDRCTRIISGLRAGNVDIIAEGLAMGREIMSDGVRVAKLLRRSYEYSPFTP